MNTLRLGSGRQFRSAALIEMPLPLEADPTVLPGARILATDGQIYESMRDWVTGEYEWKVRAQGEPGPRVDLQRSATHLQWRVEGNTGPWIDLVALADLLGPKGDKGDTGDTGPQGAGLSYQGAVATVADLPIPSTQGYAYLVASTGHLWIFSGSAWANAGPIQGPKGDKGDAGSGVELRKTSTEIQWRLEGASTWLTLVPLTEIKGDAGSDVELRKTSTEIQWRLVGGPTWLTLVALDDIRGPVGDIGPKGDPGAGFSYQGAVAAVANLPNPSTQGFAFKVLATGDLYIFNGSAWVNAGPLQGPKGDQGDQGVQGNPGNGFSFQGSLANTGLLPNPSTQGFAYRIGTDLYIYNGSAWVNAGPLQGPKGDQGDQGIQGNPGASFSFRGILANTGLLPIPSTQGFAYRIGTDLWIYNGGTSQWDNAGPLQGPKGDQGDQGNQGPAGPVAGATGQAVWNNGGNAAGASGLTFDSSGNINRAAFAGPVYQARSVLTASSGVYTLDVQLTNEFVTAAAVAGATTINLSNLTSIPSGFLWRGVLAFSYTSGTISWFTGNPTFIVKWDGNVAMTPTAGEVEKVVIEVFGGSTVIDIAPLKGRA